MTRAEHVQWCKKRALEYAERGDLLNAVTSMGSDMSKHPECGMNPYLLMIGTMDAQSGDRAKVIRWIKGFAE